MFHHVIRISYERNGAETDGEDAVFLNNFDIVPFSFKGWLNLNGHPEGAGWLDDSDGDTVINGMEYALAGSKWTNDTELLPVAKISNGDVTVTFRRRGLGFSWRPPRMEYIIERTDDLASGDWDSEGLESAISNTSNSMVFRFSPAADKMASYQFFRLRIVQHPEDE